MRIRISTVVVLAALGLVAACGGEGEEITASCPTEGTTLTYDNFGKAFFDTYCNSCHSAEGAARQGAPSGDVFDTQDAIVGDKGEIYEVSAGSNPSMPPGGGPSDAERAQLAEWLACGAP